ncbi:MAG: hypothetical protein JW800_01965, partial [Candidatus Omnitrophica bacterium]|nr:hypothetical protein [Candidatus Omnitrophota bacterium]
MTIYTYKAIDKFGKEITNEIDAGSQDEAIKKVRGLGFFPIHIGVQRKVGGKPIAPRPQTSTSVRSGLQMEIRIPFLGIGTVKINQVTLFTRQLATLI